jgi:hypothetical protein
MTPGNTGNDMMHTALHKLRQNILLISFIFAFFVSLSFNIFSYISYQQETQKAQKNSVAIELSKASILKELDELKNQDQVKINQALQKEVTEIHTTYKKTVTLYEQLLDAKASGVKLEKADETIASTMKHLAEKNYASAEAMLAGLSKQLEEKKKTQPIASVPATNAGAANVAVNNAPPTSGYQRQKVKADIGEFVVDIVSADLSSTRVIVDTATDGDCRDNCPVLSLGEYVARNGAFAGINGSYFCPATYPSCAGKTNSFDLLVMNKNKKYINSDNNVYSTNPAVIFGGGYVRFVGRALEWGRDTGVDGVLSNYPMMVSGGNVVFGGDGDPKKGSKGPRGFVGAKGNIVYIGIVHGATVAEAAHVLKTLGVEHAMNLDSGGSTALWHGGYKAGPGRNIPNAILFVRK